MTEQQKKAVEEAAKYCTSLLTNRRTKEIAEYAFTKGAEEVINNPSKYGLQPINEWVSCKDRLPADAEEVLIYVGIDIVQAYYKDGYWKGSCLVTDNMNDGFVNDRVICKQGSHFDFVTHWQPLPQPPINEREEG